MNEVTTYYIPSKAYSEMKFILYNAKDLDSVIKEDKERYIRTINVSANAWRKGITCYNNTLENQVINMMESHQIKRLCDWKILICNFLDKLKNKYPTYYRYYILRYKCEKSHKEIEEITSFNREKQRNLSRRILQSLYFLALNFGLYQREEVLCQK